MANVVIVHGIGANSRDNWFPWLKGELEKLGCSVIVPDFPRSSTPRLDEWLTKFHKHNKEVDENAILVGHSLGCAFILSALEFRKKPVKAAFFVAGFTGLLEDAELNPLIGEFSDRDFDWERIRGSCKRFYVINSDNDHYVPLENAYQLALNLAVEVKVVKGGGHFNQPEFPELLDAVKKEL